MILACGYLAVGSLNITMILACGWLPSSRLSQYNNDLGMWNGYLAVGSLNITMILACGMVT